jgi:uncharacterized protein (TIGR03067 family)
LRSARAFRNYVLNLEYRFPALVGQQRFDEAYLYLHAGEPDQTGWLKSISIPLPSQWNQSKVYGGIGVKCDPFTAVFPATTRGEWNRLNLTTRDGTIEIVLNGKKVGTVTGCQPSEGFIALHAAEAEVHYRNVEIKELPPTYKDDKDRLQGHWIAESVEMDGEVRPKEITARMTMTFTGNKVKATPVVAPHTGEGFFYLDEQANPKKIDFINEGRKGQFGIYRFDGDRFVLCGGDDDAKDRPTEFRSQGGKNRMLAVFKRAATAEPAWVPLFNGKDLTGWKDPPPNKDQWKVQDGILIGQGKNTALYSTREFRDFHCRLEVKVSTDFLGDFGFRYRGLRGFRVRLGNPTGKEFRGTLRSVGTEGPGQEFIAMQEKELAAPDTWFPLEVIAKGRHLTVLLNGIKTAEAEVGPLNFAGQLYLYAGQGTIQIRKIEIKELPLGLDAPDRPEQQKVFKSLGVAFHAFYDLYGKVPADAAALKPFLGGDEKAWQALNDNSVVFFFNIGFQQMARGKENTIVAFETRTSAKGGYVLMADGSVWHVTPQQFTDLTLADWWWLPETTAYQPLFNGKDLTGWKAPPGQNINWSVEGKELVLRGPTVLFSQREDYRDFRYRIEAKIEKGDWAYQYFRHTNGPEPRFGYKTYMANGAGTLLSRFKGAIEPVLLHRAAESQLAPDGWFTQEVIVKGSHMVILLDGKKVFDQRHDDAGTSHQVGAVGFEIFGREAVFRVRKIEIRELPKDGAPDKK